MTKLMLQGGLEVESRQILQGEDRNASAFVLPSIDRRAPGWCRKTDRGVMDNEQQGVGTVESCQVIRAKPFIDERRRGLFGLGLIIARRILGLVNSGNIRSDLKSRPASEHFEITSLRPINVSHQRGLFQLSWR